MTEKVIMKVRLNKNLYGGQKIVTIPKESSIKEGDIVLITKVNKQTNKQHGSPTE